MAALKAEAGRARTTHTQAPDDPKVEHRVSLAAQGDGFAQDLNAERQAALAKAKAVALAEADAKTAKATEWAAEEAFAAWEAAVAKQR